MELSGPSDLKIIVNTSLYCVSSTVFWIQVSFQWLSGLITHQSRNNPRTPCDQDNATYYQMYNPGSNVACLEEDTSSGKLRRQLIHPGPTSSQPQEVITKYHAHLHHTLAALKREFTCRTLVQLRTNKSPFLKSYLHSRRQITFITTIPPLQHPHTSSLQLHPHTHHTVTPGFVDRPRLE